MSDPGNAIDPDGPGRLHTHAFCLACSDSQADRRHLDWNLQENPKLIEKDTRPEEADIAHRWCKHKGAEWAVRGELGKGGTAPVFEVDSPEGLRALKIYDRRFSAGENKEIEKRRIDEQLKLCGHTCTSLIQIFDGGIYEERPFLLMERAPGRELKKRLGEVPRNKIRLIVDQIARAVEFLKTEGLCHRDIKASNIFVSEDFNQAKLLDISVIRNIYDPVGVGTDQDGQLPVVATARYSPPEYLFRLEDSGPELWHALNVYQLGALLHDLIMREPLFEIEYKESFKNRYRFAWIVATKTPIIRAVDIDQDLVFKAKRALDKDWRRRGSLKIKDFMADSYVQERDALELLSLASSPDVPQRPDASGNRLRRIREVAEHLRTEVHRELRQDRGVTTTHHLNAGPQDTSKTLKFEWQVPYTGLESRTVTLELNIRIEETDSDRFRMTATLSTTADKTICQASLKLPPVMDSEKAESELLAQVAPSLGSLAVELSRRSDE